MAEKCKIVNSDNNLTMWAAIMWDYEQLYSKPVLLCVATYESQIDEFITSYNEG